MIEVSIIAKILQPLSKLGFVFYLSRLLKKRMLKYNKYKLIAYICEDECENPKNCLKNNIHYKRALDDTTHQFGRYSFYSPKKAWIENLKQIFYMHNLKNWKIYKTQHKNETWLRFGYCGTYDDFIRGGLLNENFCDNYERVNEYIVINLSSNVVRGYKDVTSKNDRDELNKYIEE